MALPPDVQKCIAFVGVRLPDASITYTGTAFFVAVTERRGDATFDMMFTYIVSAKHVVDQLVYPDGIIRINRVNKDATYLIPSRLRWYTTESGRDDVCVAPIELDTELDVRYWHAQGLVAAGDFAIGNFGIGDNAFMISLYPGFPGREMNTPVMRTGTIAMLPSERVWTEYGSQDAILIEATSLGGTSGSPAFVEHRSYHRVSLVQPLPSEPVNFIKCLGLVSGHFEGSPTTEKGTIQKLNERLVVVIPAWKIWEVLFGAELSSARRDWWDRTLGSG